MATTNRSNAKTTKAAKSSPETPEAKSEQREAAATVTRDQSGDKDRVAAVSRLADGTPDQTPDFEVLDAPEGTREKRAKSADEKD